MYGCLLSSNLPIKITHSKVGRLSNLQAFVNQCIQTIYRTIETNKLIKVTIIEGKNKKKVV